MAAIVAETMDNYLLHGHLVQCKVVPPEEVHPKLWIGADKKFRPVPKGRIERLKHNAVSILAFRACDRRLMYVYRSPRLNSRKTTSLIV